ncbi:uncharacterized protein LOC124487476 [Hypomesus transpacificus]|uniref:uncharacterized protein LOC124487476 n=1 Tax=Hypomesus transpacificus TaxID=137520 RepID=UPI001F08603B|nr:uncharacterized protein LOC124487476 [Hypomesus transpacificus]XP_046905799.1 uncharacterized protein LOC124487476 [Hypomesus transpacificus]XP_046905800.1 uncharacterized protein LOC124487476 [Hypomesus transpacificus]
MSVPKRPTEGGARAILSPDQTVPAGPPRVTAQEVRSLQHPLLLEMNRKWAKRTAKMTPSLAEHGTFDLSLCNDMRVLVANHGHSGSVKEKLRKQKEEAGVLKLYEQQGQNYCDTVKACLLAAKTDHRTLDRASPPPYDKEKSSSAPPRNTLYTGEAENPRSSSIFMARSTSPAPPRAQSPVHPLPSREAGQGRPVRDRWPPSYYQAPILVRGDQMYYVPWMTMDMTGLITRLPNPYEGASRWIKAFEQETLGHNISIGDIKMILGRTLGAGGLSDVMHSRHLADVLSSHVEDENLFNGIRTEVWENLRTLFPDRVRLDMLIGETIEPSEPPMAFIHKTLGNWRPELGKNPEEAVLQQAMFRQGVVQGLSETVQGRLGDKVSLYSMPFAQFCKHITHAVLRERKNENKRLQSDREDVRKLNKLQLKSGLQAVLMTPPGGYSQNRQWGSKPEVLALGLVSQ